MPAAGRSVPTSPRPRGDGVVRTLIRLIVTTKRAYRDVLVDLLFRHRRREGYFAPLAVDLTRRRPRRAVQAVRVALDKTVPQRAPRNGTGRW